MTKQFNSDKFLASQKRKLIKMGWSEEQATMMMDQFAAGKPGTPNFLLDAKSLLDTMSNTRSGSAPKSKAIGSAFKQLDRHAGYLSHHGCATDLENNLRSIGTKCEDLDGMTRLSALLDMLGMPKPDGKTYEIPELFQELGLGAYACKKAKTILRNAQLASIKEAKLINEDLPHSGIPLKNMMEPFAFMMKHMSDHLIDMTPALAEKIIECYMHSDILNAKESFCFQQMCNGATQSEIAAMMGCSERMIRKYKTKIIKKLQMPMKEQPALSEQSINQKLKQRIDSAANAYIQSLQETGEQTLMALFDAESQLKDETSDTEYLAAIL